MIKPFYSLIILSLAIASCNNAPNKTQLPITNKPSRPQTSPPGSVLAKGKVTPYGPRDIVRNIIQDKKGNIWIASWEGAYRYDPSAALRAGSQQFTNFTEADGLGYIHVFSLLEDKKGNIWWGTIGGGVCRYDGKYGTNFTTKQGLSNDVIFCIMEDNAGNIWFGTEAGVSRYDGKGFTNFTTADGLIGNKVYTMVQDNNGTIWLGTDDGVSCYDPSTTLRTGSKKFTDFEKKENLREAITNITPKAGPPLGNVRALIKDRSGNIWMGSQYGVSKYDGRTFTNYTEKDGLQQDFICTIVEDNMGNLWFGGGGASRYDGKTFTVFTDKQGLCSNNVFGLCADNAGNIWFATMDASVCKYNGKIFTSLPKTSLK